MSRHKTTIRIALVTAMLLVAGGTSVEARPSLVQETAQVTRVAKKKSPGFWQWLKIRLTRYAMAAN